MNFTDASTQEIFSRMRTLRRIHNDAHFSQPVRCLAGMAYTKLRNLTYGDRNLWVPNDR